MAILYQTGGGAAEKGALGRATSVVGGSLNQTATTTIVNYEKCLNSFCFLLHEAEAECAWLLPIVVLPPLFLPNNFSSQQSIFLPPVCFA